MKLNEKFVRYDMNGKAMVIPLGDADFHGVVQGNKSVGVIFACLERGATEDEIVQALSERFEGDREQMRADVRDVVAKLKSIGAIDA